MIFFINQEFINLFFSSPVRSILFRVKEDTMKKIHYILGLLLINAVILLEMLRVLSAGRNISPAIPTAIAS